MKAEWKKSPDAVGWWFWSPSPASEGLTAVEVVEDTIPAFIAAAYLGGDWYGPVVIPPREGK